LNELQAEMKRIPKAQQTDDKRLKQVKIHYVLVYPYFLPRDAGRRPMSVRHVGVLYRNG